MGKKILIIAVCLLVGLSGFAAAFSLLSRSSSAENVQESAESQTDGAREALVGYFRSLKLGDVETAYTYCADSAQDALSLKSRKEAYLESFTDDNARYQEQASDYYDYRIASVFKEYEIQTLESSQDSAVADVVILGNDASRAEEVTEDEIREYMDTYISENEESLQQILDEQGEDAVTEYLSDVSGEYTFQQMKDAIKAAPSGEMELQVQLTRTEDGWKISSLSLSGASIL